MRSPLFYLRYALRSLRRDGQRTLLGILCIAFGVLSLVSMQLLAGMIGDVIDRDPRLVLNGDAAISAESLFVSESDLAQVEQWQREGVIGEYSVRAERWGVMLKTDESGRVEFLNQVQAIDPQRFGLVAEPLLSEPPGVTLANVLRAADDAVLTRDVADEFNLAVGDMFLLSTNRAPARLRVAGIADSTPNGIGSSVFYSLETAQQLSQREDVITELSILWGAQGESAAETLSAAGWRVRTPEAVREERRTVSDLFGITLKGAGILGLIVGGIGVANTMQVLLARRTQEIATLKTLGYRQGDLLALFGIETALMGVLGGALGALAAYAVSRQLFALMSRTGAMLGEGNPDIGYVFGGLLVGLLIAVIFGLQAIVASSAVRPVTLLRNLPTPQSARTRLTVAALYVLLVLMFSALSAFVMGSPVTGVGVVIVGAIVLGGIALLFRGVLRVTLGLPLPPLPILTLARNNLKRKPRGAVVALVALFAGIYAISFSAATITSAQDEVERRRAPEEGYNLVVYAAANDAEMIERTLQEMGATATYTRLRVPVQGRVVGDSAPENSNGDMIQWVEGRDPATLAADVQIVEGAWQGETDGALLSTFYLTPPWNVAPGSTIELRAANGVRQTVRVVGFYEPLDIPNVEGSPNGLIVSRATAAALSDGAGLELVLGRVPVQQQRALSAKLAEQFPDTIVYSLAEQNDAITRAYQNLFIFVAGVAGLALAAGAILIANSVGLALVERRREIGILKAVGYTSGGVLGTLLAEYALLGLLAGVIGTGAVVVTIVVLRLVQPAAAISLHPLLALGMALFSVALAMVSAAAVAWQPTQVRPLEVLRYE